MIIRICILWQPILKRGSCSSGLRMTIPALERLIDLQEGQYGKVSKRRIQPPKLTTTCVYTLHMIAIPRDTNPPMHTNRRLSLNFSNTNSTT
ncbi:unnamed protein product, partial [Mesorhabditis belari]|uniref:Uncharacterized protein n=1 Tax=Mesorhabditis belari TaxID=2138241 RepID=A0AAF3EDZ6_9BILA